MYVCIGEVADCKTEHLHLPTLPILEDPLQVFPNEYNCHTFSPFWHLTVCRLLYCCDSSSSVSEGQTEKCTEERCPGKKHSQSLHKVFRKGCKICLINVSVNNGGYTTSIPIEMLTNSSGLHRL